jgi:predicted O-methyltransferase YrrM
MVGSWDSKDSMQIKVREGFGNLLNRLGLHGNGIEIGVAEGDFSTILLQTSRLQKLYLLDTWQEQEDYEDSNNVKQKEQEDRYFSVLARMEQYGRRVTVIRADANVAHEYLLNEDFDFVYVDADHSYEAVKRNLSDWYPKIKPGGIFAGHDYIDGKMGDGTVFGVKQAVDEFVKELENVKLYVTTDDTAYFPDGSLVPENMRYFSWYFRKPV